ncbi:MAG: ClpXP protease specificity-enhancing factor SspB [Rhodopseudomonas palustris]|nr:ClpXP protease specificity-enhancing factor SspB [Rhodopseudomonas palustris]
MATDHIRYDVLARDALRGVLRQVLADAAEHGLPGEHHFFITFFSKAEGVKMSPRLQAQYPNEMTIVLQHQFWDLVVTDDHFEVGLAFGGIPERLFVPFSAIKSFLDPSVNSVCNLSPTPRSKPRSPIPTAPPPPPRQPRRTPTSCRRSGRPRRPKAPRWCGSTVSARNSPPGSLLADSGAKARVIALHEDP